MTAPDAGYNDFFGCSVTVSGVAVGAYNHTVGTDDSQGAVYAFSQSGGIWIQQAELLASDGGQADRFGYSVALSGSTVLVGAPVHVVRSQTAQGAAYIFVESNGSFQVTSDCAANVSAQVFVSRGGFRFDHATGMFIETVTMSNKGAALSSVSLVLDALSSNATLTDAGGTTRCDAPLGSPWLTIPAGLKFGESVSTTLTFSDPSKASIQYTTRVLAGTGER